MTVKSGFDRRIDVQFSAVSLRYVLVFFFVLSTEIV